MANQSSTTSSNAFENRDREQDLKTTKREPDLKSTIGSTVGEIGGEKAREFVGKAQENASTMMNRAGEVAGQIQDAASEYVESATEYLRRYPVQSVLIGFGAGIVLGALLSPRRLS
jgi:ElaB/YqjD/DUF883 family membrane-anchored ribosome-binding protein